SFPSGLNRRFHLWSLQEVITEHRITMAACLCMTLKRIAIGFPLFITCLAITLTVLHLQAEPQRRPQERQRINGPVDERRMVRLPQTTHSLTRQAQDRGRVTTDLPMDRVVL